METAKYEEDIKCWASEIEPWRESARGVLTDGWDMQDIVDLHADELIGQISRGDISVKQLRAGVAWANALDDEAQSKFGTELLDGNFAFERTARRIMHHAGRLALGKVNNQRKRTILAVNRAKSSTIR